MKEIRNQNENQEEHMTFWDGFFSIIFVLIIVVGGIYVLFTILHWITTPDTTLFGLVENQFNFVVDLFQRIF